MGGQPAFHLFRFPIHIRPGFLMFMALVVFVNPNEFGVWLAGSAAVLTLMHELGHAFAARATGAEAEISLDLLAGYASFVPVRSLKRWERAGISIAGPAVQVGVGVALLLLMGAHPFDVQFGDSAAVQAIRWTGPVMGLFNLVPVLPLDGGNIAMAGLDVILPGRSRIVMLWFSVALTGGVAVVLFLTPRYQGLAFFVVFPLLVQLQMLTSTRSGAPRPRSTAGADGEAQAWADGDLSAIPAGLVPSPWYRAHQQLRAGDPDTARAVLLADLASDERPNWWPPDTAPRETLRALVDLLPRPLPHGRAYSELALVRVLQLIGRHDDAARYGSASFSAHRSSAMALMVAQSAAALDDRETAIAWLAAGIQAGNDLDGIADGMDRLADFDAVRDDERFRQMRAALDEP